ncbi:MAG: hypothetical protein KDD40_11455 [Bdellovibrionales bacterium]|nr:hypothetical protein [Bdellovibrionales bacterium]
MNKLISPVIMISLISLSWTSSQAQEEGTQEAPAQMAQPKGKGMGMKPGMMNRMRGMMNRPNFKEVDADADGKITSKELSDFRAKRMASRAKEGRMMRNASTAPEFKTLDKNKDGVLTPDEYPPAPRRVNPK